MRVAVVLSGLVVIAWAVLIRTTPSDPQIGIEYVFTTVYALLALAAIWAVAILLRLRRRR